LFARACRIPGVVILVPALVILVERALRLMGDQSGQTPIGYFILFVFGFVMVADERITAAVRRHWPWALALGVAAMTARTALWPHTDEWAWRSWQDIVFNWLVYVLGVWMMIVGLLGLFHRFADRPNRAYAYATEAAYPFYILHQTVIVLLAYFVVRWGIGIPLEFTVIALVAFVVSVAVCEVAVRRWVPVRFLFGMKPRSRPAGEGRIRACAPEGVPAETAGD
jgi:peptidoglycan/LPS O-acetylase OafA/YrhL